MPAAAGQHRPTGSRPAQPGRRQPGRPAAPGLPPACAGPGATHDRRPLFLYDGDCGFCSAAVRLMQRRVRPALHIQPWQRADLAALGWTVADASREVLWADAGGRRAGGARAVALALSTGCGGWPAVGAMLRLPPLSWLASAIYRLIARHRYRLPGGTPTCAAADRQPADPCDPARG